jgi:ABC-type multidrug transport system permease subunit
MNRAIFNFLKADLRMPQLMFWDWCFPVILILVIGIFIGETSLSIFLLPGFVSLFLMQSIIFSIPYRLAQYNESGLMRFIKEKGSAIKLIMGFFLSRIFILVLQTFIVILIGKTMMKVDLNMNWGFLIISFLFTVAIFMLISSVLGLKLKTQNAALGLSQAIYFVLIGISGIVYPLENSPELLRKLSAISPLMYISKFWESALYGKRIFQIQDVLILCAMLAVFTLYVIYMSRSGKGGNSYEGYPSDQ